MMEATAEQENKPMKTNRLLAAHSLSIGSAAFMSAALLSAVWSAALAAPVTSKQAASVVTGWLSLDRTPLGETLGTSVRRVETFNDPAGSPLYYICLAD
jgi:hypothetical protein